MTKKVDEIGLLSALGISVLERGTVDGLSVVGTPPAWFADVLGDANSLFSAQVLLLTSPFLADFFQEACDSWKNSAEILASGTWSQRNLNGDEAAFQAWALRSEGRDFLLIRQLEDFEEQRRAFQKAREMELSQEGLDRIHRKLSEAKDALETRNREVERVNQLKSEFLASMSHELRTPLCAIVGFSDLLEEQNAGILNELQLTYVQHVGKASRHLLALINEILDLSKIEAGHLELNPECFTFSEALSEVLSTIRPLARCKNINVGIRLCSDDTIYADRLRFNQILYNLLSNATKFTPDFGDFYIDCSREEASVVISVSDNGIGVPVEEQEAIFEKFHQARPSAAGVKEGSGLGLAITRRLVEAHGGRIWAESTHSPGTRFTFTLPWHSSAAEASAATISDQNRAAASETPEWTRLEIAVVEDDVAASSLLESLLQPVHDVTSYKTVFDALEAFKLHPPDLVLMNVRLVSSGEGEILNRLPSTEALRRVPVIAISGHAMAGDRERLLDSGFDGYLAKPLPGRLPLLEVINRFAGRDRPKRNLR